MKLDKDLKKMLNDISAEIDKMREAKLKYFGEPPKEPPKPRESFLFDILDEHKSKIDKLASGMEILFSQTEELYRRGDELMERVINIESAEAVKKKLEEMAAKEAIINKFFTYDKEK